MTTLSATLLALTSVVAIVDWWATWNQRREVRMIAKPLTLALLIGVALSVESFESQVRTWMVIGLVLSLGGDIFLLFEEKFFVFGLASFLLGHIAYVVAMQYERDSTLALLVGLAVVAASVAVVGRRIVGAVNRGDHPELTGPVIAYLVVISAMVVSAFGTMGAAAIVGAVLFYISDATLAWNRFVQPFRAGPLAVMVTYHLGQIGLTMWLVM